MEGFGERLYISAVTGDGLLWARRGCVAVQGKGKVDLSLWIAAEYLE